MNAKFNGIEYTWLNIKPLKMLCGDTKMIEWFVDNYNNGIVVCEECKNGLAIGCAWRMDK